MEGEQAEATEDEGANSLWPMPALAPARQTPRVSESRRGDGKAFHTWEGPPSCQVKAGLVGGHGAAGGSFSSSPWDVTGIALPSDSRQWQAGSVPTTVISACLPITFGARGREECSVPRVHRSRWVARDQQALFCQEKEHSNSESGKGHTDSPASSLCPQPAPCGRGLASSHNGLMLNQTSLPVPSGQRRNVPLPQRRGSAQSSQT